MRGKDGEGSPLRGCLDGGTGVGFDVSILPKGALCDTRVRKAPGHVHGHTAPGPRLGTHS